MASVRRCRKGLLLLLLAGVGGCTKPAPVSAPPPRDAEPELRARFAQFQEALEKRDGERLWSMLTARSQADAERIASTLRAEYDKADAAAKTELEKELGLPAAELARLTGRDLVKTQPFHKRYKEVREGKFERADVVGDNATVHFRDEDGEQEKLILLREEGQWKLWLKIPSVRRLEP